MRIGLIGKDNNKGLGQLTKAYRKHLPIAETYIVIDNITNYTMDDAVYVQHLDQVPLPDVDVLISLEMLPFRLWLMAKESNVATLLKVNYEFLPESLPVEPDHYLCSSSLNHDAVSSSNKTLLADPVDLDDFTYKKRTKAKTFLHNAGTLGMGGANGTVEVIEAFKKTKTQPKLILNSQKMVECDYRNAEYRLTNVDHPSELFQKGDVFVMPQKFRATSLPIQEAMACGMPVISTDIQPFNEFCQWLSPVSAYNREYLSRPINSAIIDTDALAATIDSVYNKDISSESADAYTYAQSISWQKLKPNYLTLCSQLKKRKRGMNAS